MAKELYYNSSPADTGLIIEADIIDRGELYPDFTVQLIESVTHPGIYAVDMPDITPPSEYIIRVYKIIQPTLERSYLTSYILKYSKEIFVTPPLTTIDPRYIALCDAISEGVLRVKYSNKEVEYRSLNDMLIIKRLLEADPTINTGTKKPKCNDGRRTAIHRTGL